MMRASGTTEALDAGVTQRLRAVVGGGYSEARREADTLRELVGELRDLLQDLDEPPPESLDRPLRSGG